MSEIDIYEKLRKNLLNSKLITDEEWEEYQQLKKLKNILNINTTIEEKKIPENLPFNNEMRLNIMEVYHELEKYNYKINEIIDYLKSKGE